MNLVKNTTQLPERDVEQGVVSIITDSLGL